MALILSIESSTVICSVAIARDGEVIALRESHEGRDHARLTAQFVDDLLKECGVEASALDAVVVSRGPGSYTGLRIGVSLAKGLCYGLNIPLLGVDSLEALAELAIASGECGAGDTLVPMVDARRMEVYCQMFDMQRVAQCGVEAMVIGEESFSDRADRETMVFFGDGAQKCAEVLPWARIIDIKPSAAGVAAVAETKFGRGESEDVAYFEPLYLKDAVVTVSKKRLF